MSRSQNKTGCVCKKAGWCERHKCNKTDHFVHLCQTNEKYFEAWENGTGPGQAPPPDVLQKSKNFAKAAVEHIKTGMQHCSEEQKQERFRICSSKQCGYYMGDDSGGVCTNVGCGCYIRPDGKFIDKLSWADSKCPAGLWGPVEIKTQENTENGV